MEQSKALSALKEAADLVGMVEELTNPAIQDQLSQTSRSGLRITLRSIKEKILSSHDAIASGFVNSARKDLSSSVERANTAQAPTAEARKAQLTRAALAEAAAAKIQRKEIRS